MALLPCDAIERFLALSSKEASHSTRLEGCADPVGRTNPLPPETAERAGRWCSSSLILILNK